jgi:hypothetical protein
VVHRCDTRTAGDSSSSQITPPPSIYTVQVTVRLQSQLGTFELPADSKEAVTNLASPPLGNTTSITYIANTTITLAVITRIVSCTNFVVASSALAFQVGVLYPWHKQLDEDFEKLRTEHLRVLKAIGERPAESTVQHHEHRGGWDFSWLKMRH